MNAVLNNDKEAIMKSHWIKYYKELFTFFESGMFLMLWGNDCDEDDEEYAKIYAFELIEMKNNFAEFMYIFNKYNLFYNPVTIAHYLIFLFEDLGDCDYPAQSLEVAKMLVETLDKKLSVNSVPHPHHL